MARRGSKSSVSIALICTTRRRIPACTSTNQGPEKGGLTPLIDQEGYLAHKKLPPPHRATMYVGSWASPYCSRKDLKKDLKGEGPKGPKGSWEEALSYEEGIPVGCRGLPGNFLPLDPSCRHRPRFLR